MTAAGIAHLRIKLDDVEPAVVRRVDVPLTIRLDRLHLVLQVSSPGEFSPNRAVEKPTLRYAVDALSVA